MSVLNATLQELLKLFLGTELQEVAPQSSQPDSQARGGFQFPRLEDGGHGPGSVGDPQRDGPAVGVFIAIPFDEDLTGIRSDQVGETPKGGFEDLCRPPLPDAVAV